MAALVAAVACLAYWDARRESSTDLHDFASEQTTLAQAIPASVGRTRDGQRQLLARLRSIELGGGHGDNGPGLVRLGLDDRDAGQHRPRRGGVSMKNQRSKAAAMGTLAMGVAHEISRGAGAGGGTGLGLAIAHESVASHRGTLEFSARRPRGTTAMIRLPAAEGILDA